MRKTVAVIAASALLAILPSSARAQDEKKIHVNFGGGPTFPAGDLGNHFNTGWGPAIGVTMDTGNPRFSLQFEYAYRYMGISRTPRFRHRSSSGTRSMRITRPISWTST